LEKRASLISEEEDLAVGEMLEIQEGKIIHSKVFHL
jgi:hypothetical protein